jgi:protein-disulfide isomerase
MGASPADKRRATLLRLGVVLALAAIAVAVAVVLSSRGAEGPSAGGGDQPEPSAVYAGIPQAGVLLGGPKAKARLIEFADLQCPFCAEYALQAMPTVVEQYVRTERVRYELRVRSFLGPDSLRAAGAASAAAAENRLYQFTDAFFRAQGTENSGYVTDAFLRRIAEQAGVNPDAAVAAAGNARRQPLVRDAERLAASLGSSSTPDFYLRLPSGRLVAVRPPQLTPEAFTEALDQALAQT